MMLIYVYICLLLTWTTFGGSVQSNYLTFGGKSIQSNDFQLISSQTTKSSTAHQLYLQIFTNNPSVVVGMMRWYQQPQIITKYEATIDSIDQMGFSISYVVSADSTIQLQSYYWMAVDVVLLPMFHLLPNVLFQGTYSDLYGGNGEERCISFQSDFALQTPEYVYPEWVLDNRTLNTPVLLGFLQGFEITNVVNSILHVNLTVSMTNSTTYQSTVCSSNNSVVTRVLYGRMVFSQIDIESDGMTFVDWGVLTAYNNNWANLYRNFTTITFNHSKLMVGLSGFRLSTGAIIDYLYAVTTNPISGIGNMQFTAMSVGYFYVSAQSCDQGSTYKYLHKVDWRCYDICPAGYFSQDGTPTGFCLTCDVWCQTCSGSATLCTVCQNGTVMNPPATCIQCATAQYLSNGTCVNCPIGCQVCDASACQQCSSGYYQYLGVCYTVCPTGYYGHLLLCDPCGSLCEQCVDSTNCTLCGPNTVTSGIQCVCDELGGWVYAAHSNMCQRCQIMIVGCQQCSGGSCSFCNSTAGFVSDGVGGCMCMAGQFWNGTTCLICPFGCSACIDQTQCTDCMTTFVMDAGICVCPSPTLLYLSLCEQCSNIISGCATCADNTTCGQCMTGLTLAGGVCQCPGATTFISGSCQYCSTCCSPGFYADPISLTCIGCMSMCQTCSSANDCSMCVVGSWWNGTNCVCNVGTYLNGLSCSLCSRLFDNCLECSQVECYVCDVNSTKNGLQCVCNPTYVLSNGICTSCSNIMVGCTDCSNEITCVSCDISLKFMLNGTNCVCQNGLFLNSIGVCSNCSDFSSGCNLCTQTGCTQCDTTLNYVLNSSMQCQCINGYYMDAGVCIKCSVGCTMCQDAINCFSCSITDRFVLVGNVCVCDVGFMYNAGICTCGVGFYPSGGNCLACSGSCVNCTGPTSSECTSCASPATLSGSTCVCPQGMFQSATPLVCSACDPTCLNCSASATTCTACDTLTTNRVLSGSSCVCSAPYAETGSVSCGCDAGFSMANNVCNEICGDGIRFTLACDDGNTVSGDGCAPDCTIETDFVCRGGNSTAPSECSYNKSIDIVLQKTTKNSTANEVSFQFLVQPPLSSLSALDFSTCVTTNLTGATLTFQYDSQGILTIIVSYNESIQNADVSLQFAPTVSGVPFFYSTPNSVYNFVVQPDNNQAAVVYPESVYGQGQLLQYVDMGVCALALVGFVVSLFSGKFIGLEMTGVVQVAVIGLAAVDYLHPLLAPLTKIGFINGYNSALSAPTKSAVPARLSALDYCTQMINSLNFTVAVMLLPFLVALGLLFASKVSKTREKTLLQHSKTALCEYGMTGVVFVLYNAVVALSVFLLYFEGTSSSLFPLSIVDAGLTVAALVTVTVLYKLMPDGFGDFKNGFKKDAASQLHYWLVLLFRVLLGVLLVALNDIAFVGFICAGIPLVAVVYLAVRRPYSYAYNNARAIFNEVVMLVVLAIYGYYRITGYSQHSTSIGNTLPIIVLILLVVVLAINFGCMIKYYIDKKRQKKHSVKKNLSINIQKIQEQQNQYLFEQAKQRMKNLVAKKTPKKIMTRFKNLNVSEDMPQEHSAPHDSSVIHPNTSIVLKGLKEQIIQNLIPKTSQVNVLNSILSEEEKKQINNQFDNI